MKTIGFNIYSFSFRGTEIAIFDYADKNETILNNKSIILSPIRLLKDLSDCPEILDKFLNRFEKIHWFSDNFELDELCKNLNIDAVYFLKYGTKTHNPYMEIKIPSLIHCVYTVDDNHGKVYASVSESVSLDKPLVPVVPHMLNLSITDVEDLRNTLKIPKNAKVFGRHGGKDTFCFPNIEKVLKKVLDIDPNIYFLFMPLPDILKDINHPRLKSLPISTSIIFKEGFIKTCDAMLHAQILGETQGLSILEFSFYGKPVITWNGGRCQQHLINLGKEAILYNNLSELMDILLSFKNKEINKELIIYRYLPINVMREFDKIFLSWVPSRRD